jgi:adenylate cyclase class 2
MSFVRLVRSSSLNSMQQEIEVKFLNVEHDSIRKKLTTLGGICTQPLQLMRRAVMDFPDKRLQSSEGVWGWIRVRDEGSRVTVTYKQVSKDGSLKTHEIEYEASSYKDAIRLFEAIGLRKFSEQETKRETWELDGVEVMLDIWPWIDPYIEIEGSSEEAIRTLGEALGMDWDDAVKGSSDGVYRQSFPNMTNTESVSDIPELTFDVMPQWLKDRQ